MCSYLCSTSFHCPNLIFIICNSQLFSMYKSSCRGNSGLNLCMHRLLDDNKIECAVATLKLERLFLLPSTAQILLTVQKAVMSLSFFFLSLFWNLENIYYYISFFFSVCSVFCCSYVSVCFPFCSLCSVCFPFFSDYF